MPEPFPPLFATLAICPIATMPDGAHQMALDEALLECATHPTLRIYRWADPEVTIGYPQKSSDALAFASGRPFTRRCTGGGFVEHGRDVTIALAVPASHAFAHRPPVETYRRIHEAIAAALGTPGLRLATAGECTQGAACFAHPACHDLVLHGEKICGGAQRRSRAGFLYQGSLQRLEPPADFARRLAATLAPTIEESMPQPGAVAELVRTRYGSRGWNLRR